MSREIDLKIAEWLGLKVIKLRDHNFIQERYNYDVVAGRSVDNMPNTYPLPDFENSDAAAISLLPVLNLKNYDIGIGTHGRNGCWYCRITTSFGRFVSEESTIAKAITSAVIALIEKEATK